MALVGGVFSALPAKAQTVVPAAPNIVDPAGDANYLNEGFVGAGQGGDHGTPADASSIGDILAVWFTHTAETISWHVQTEAPHPSSGAAYWIEVNTNPAGGPRCLSWDMLMAAPTYQGDSFARVRDDCAATDSVFGEVVAEELADGTGVVTGTVPRSAHALLADGSTLTEPVAFMRHATGPIPSVGTFIQPTIDTTAVGTDYTISGGGPVAKPPAEEPPGKSDPPGKGKKKGCKKGKGKKKGACPGKKPPKPPTAACPAYVPGEQGAEAETSVVTDTATAEAPVEVTITAPPGIPEVALGHVFHNIQVDTASPDSGLYVAYEFPVYEDHDIYLNYASGNEAAHTGGFNPAPVPVALGCCDGTGTGGHSEQGAEFLDGVRTPDCGGYTLDMASFASEGGDMTLKLWLGEPTYDPAADGGESAMEMLYRVLGL
jgi:hypothetical protein